MRKGEFLPVQNHPFILLPFSIVFVSIYSYEMRHTAERFHRGGIGCRSIDFFCLAGAPFSKPLNRLLPLHSFFPSVKSGPAFPDDHRYTDPHESHQAFRHLSAIRT
jgi:hypothetical protein